MDRNERLRRTERKNALNLTFTDIAREADIAYGRVRGYFIGGAPALTEDELRRLDAMLAQREAAIRPVSAA